jgi:hypothetical protein
MWLFSTLSSPPVNSHLYQQLRGARRGITFPTSRADGLPYLQLRSGRREVWELLELFPGPMVFSFDAGKKTHGVGRHCAFHRGHLLILVPLTATRHPTTRKRATAAEDTGGPSTRSGHPGRGHRGEGGGWSKRAQPPGDPELLMLMVVCAWCPTMS